MSFFSWLRHTRDLAPGTRRNLTTCLWVFVALAILLLPALLPIAWPGFKPGLISVFLHLIGLLLLPAVFGIGLRGLLKAYWPFVILSPVAVFCYLSTQQQPSEWFFLVLTESNTKEASVFVPQIIGVLVLLAALIAAYSWVMRQIPVDGTLGRFGTTAVLGLAFVMPLSKIARVGLEKAGKEEAWRVMENYPVGTIAAGVKAASLSYQISHRGDAGRSLVVKSEGAPLPQGKREIHILVIGETARASSFQLNGYERETTPLLAKTPGIMSFKNVAAPAPVTTISVPVLLTPTTAVNAKDASILPSVMNVFRNGGFKGYWVSAQMKHGFWDTRCSTFSNDADEALFISGKLALSGEPRNAALDTDLLPMVREIIDRGEQKVFIVLHTMGSHAIYSDRYPEEFNHFPADPVACAAARNQLLTSSISPEQGVHLRNSYDNSILFTDFMLRQLIGLIEKTDAVSSMYYVSDHGENGGDAEVMPFGHGTLSSEVLRVPMVVWLSPQYKELRAAKAEALRSHAETAFSSDCTFHTLVDMAGLSCDLLKRERSIASPDFKPGSRMVTALDGTLADYDQQIVPGEQRKGWHPLKPRTSMAKN